MLAAFFFLRASEEPSVDCTPDGEVPAVFRESRLCNEPGRTNGEKQESASSFLPSLSIRARSTLLSRMKVKSRQGEGYKGTTHAGLLVLPDFAHPPPLVPRKFKDLEIGVNEPWPVMGKEAQDGGSLERRRIREVDDLCFVLVFILRRPRGH